MTAGTASVRVLVVDDEPPILRFLRVRLGSRGYRVIQAGNDDLAPGASQCRQPASGNAGRSGARVCGCASSAQQAPAFDIVPGQGQAFALPQHNSSIRPPKTARPTNDGNDVVVREVEVGFLGSRACFPSVSSCLTITGISPNGLRTAHITSGSRTDNLRIASALSALNAANCSAFYVVGSARFFYGEARQLS